MEDTLSSMEDLSMEDTLFSATSSSNGVANLISEPEPRHKTGQIVSCSEMKPEAWDVPVKKGGCVYRGTSLIPLEAEITSI